MKKLPDEIKLESIPVDLAAAEGESKLRKFSMTAYTGQKMTVSGFWDAPVVVDLNGMLKGNGKKPILLDHDPRQRVGHSETVSVNGSNMSVEGIISGASPAAQEVSLSSANGFPWQASVGLMVSQVTFVKEGKQVTVNGQQHEGPVYVARKSTLKEVSFVTMGADDHTSAKVAASAKQREVSMEFSKWLEAMGFDAQSLSDQQAKGLQAKFDAEQKANTPEAKTEAPAETVVQAAAPTVEETVKKHREAIAAEESRVAAIAKIAEKFPEIRAQAIKEGWDDTKTEVAVLRAERPTGPAIHSKSGGNVPALVIEAALCQKGKLNDAEKRFDDKTLQAAHDAYKGEVRLGQILLDAAYQNGYSGSPTKGITPGNLREVLQASFSTVSLPGIFSNTANKFLLEGFNYAEQAWTSISSRRSVNDFKQVTSYRLTDDMKFELIPKGGEIPHGKLGEESFTNQVKTWGKMFSLTREDIINDDLSALNAVPRLLGTGAGDALNERFWTVWQDDASFFSSGNNNYITGAGTTLQVSQLNALNLKFMKQTKPNGRPLGLTPTILLVPPELWGTALELMTSTNFNTGGAATDTKVPDRNIWANRFQIVVSAYLTSATAWWLLSDPQRLSAIEVAFLNGVTSPTTDTAEVDFNKLGIQMRAYMDFDMSKQDYRAGAKSKGAS